MNRKQKRIDAELRKNPIVQAAAVARLAVGLKYTDDTDDLNDETYQILTDCLSAMGEAENESLAVTLAEMMADLEEKMEAALVKARLLHPDCAEARESQRKAA
jgi:hypothetical protein